MTRAPKPPKTPTGPSCVKCGEANGWTGPRYQHGKRVSVTRPATATSFATRTIDTVESLDWTCVNCGYVRHEPCSSQSSNL